VDAVKGRELRDRACKLGWALQCAKHD
jgi:hypothetical protein